MMSATNPLRLLAVAIFLSAALVATGAAAQQNPPAKVAPETRKAPPKAKASAKAKAPAKRPGTAKDAQPKGAPQAAAGGGERFDDWRLGCERPPGAPREACFVEQRLSHKDTPDRLALAVAIGYFAPEGKPAMILKVPPNAIQQAGIIIRVDDRPVREVGIRNCGPDNCSVMALLDDDLLTEMRRGKQAVVAYSRKESDDIVRIAVSLRGLTRGLAALQKR